MMTPDTNLELAPDLVLVDPWAEEGETPGGLYAAHDWEDQAGYAFGTVLVKSKVCTSLYAEALMGEISPGDVIMFVRGAHRDYKAQVNGEDAVVSYVNIEDVLTVLELEDVATETPDGTSSDPVD